MEHIVNDCPLRLFSGGLAGLSGLEDGSLNWLNRLTTRQATSVDKQKPQAGMT
ncbi:hypothetical protein J6590_007699 [Homalodisca vitripennis]|nr:hypothetical protein J6590_007699 [Homalodisca vitripennis]